MPISPSLPPRHPLLQDIKGPQSRFSAENKAGNRLDGHYFKPKIMVMVLHPSLHIDPFARENLPPETQWPLFEFSLPALAV